MVRHYCDRCKKQISDLKGVQMFPITRPEKNEFVHKSDLCKECFEKFEEIVSLFLSNFDLGIK